MKCSMTEPPRKRETFILAYQCLFAGIKSKYFAVKYLIAVGCLHSWIIELKVSKNHETSWSQEAFSAFC